jgi:hypothetical protein
MKPKRLFALFCLEVQKIHAYPNNCIIGCDEEYEKLEVCSVSKASRYRIRHGDPFIVEGKPSRKRISAKVK